MNTPTPRTDAESFLSRGMGIVPTLPKEAVRIDFARTLERELTAVTEQRDRLAEALRKFVGDALFCSHANTTTTVLPHRQVGDSGDALNMP